MFMSEAKKPLLGALLALSFLSSPAVAGDAVAKKNIDAALIYPIKDGKYQAYSVNTQGTKGFSHYGRTPTAAEIKAWDKDVMPDGTGLPEGKGSVEEGDELYAEKCAMCHGDFGAGGKGYPTLSGGEGTLKNQLVHPEKGDEPPVRTIGSYWPYASTLFWYIQSAMPFPNPKSLSNDETYAIVAYLLSVNEIEIDGEELDDDYILDRAKFLKIKMPNEDGFYPEVNGDVGTKEMSKYLNNPKNYGAGTRCMKDCDDTPVVAIKNELKDFHPAPSTIRDLPSQKEVGEVSEGQKLYEATCSVCHASEAIGAPVVGDKETWVTLGKKGLDELNKNAINGINAMPPRGGNMDLSDDQINKIVEYMIKASQ
jgi:cytochrome c